jgi:hypothetical protein
MKSRSTLDFLQAHREYLQHQGEQRQIAEMNKQSIRVKELEIKRAAMELASHRAALDHWERARKLIKQALLDPQFNEAQFWADWTSEGKIYGVAALPLSMQSEQLTREIVGAQLEINDMLQKALDEVDRLLLEFEKEQLEQMRLRLKP